MHITFVLSSETPAMALAPPIAHSDGCFAQRGWYWGRGLACTSPTSPQKRLIGLYLHSILSQKKGYCCGEKALALTLTPHSNGYFRVAADRPALYPQ